ncbi:IPT/TIG domain-containing protein [bacterium]|nr:IPT/TIG domain-containing protein [bacterium]
MKPKMQSATVNFLFIVIVLFFIFLFLAAISEVNAVSTCTVNQSDIELKNISRKANASRANWKQSAESWNLYFPEVKRDGKVKIFMHRTEFKAPRQKNASSLAGRFRAFEIYDQIDMEGTKIWDGRAGAPILPVKPLSILIPFQHQVSSIKVFKGPCKKIEGEFFLEPAQSPVPTNYCSKVMPTPPDPSIYESDSEYPASPCGDAFIQKRHGYTMLILNLFPVKYHPLDKKISYYPEIELQIETVLVEGSYPDGPDNEGIRIKANPNYKDEIRSLVDNPDILDTYTEEQETGYHSDFSDQGSALPQGVYDYLIITNNALRDSQSAYTFNDLVALKQSKGLSAAIVTIEDDIYPYYTGTENGDNADKIRHFIANAYSNWGTRWILLGGDIEIIPKRGVYVSEGSYSSTNLPTDLYFACLDGPWNNDKDSLWGEYNDGANGKEIDLSPEVFIGRAPVSNETELSNFVAKTIKYETIPHPNDKTAILLGEKLDDVTWGSASSIAIRDKCLTNDWNIFERYDSTGGWSGSTFINDLNASPHIVEHLGHANETYNARIYSSNVAALTNEYPYIMYSQGCNSGSFDTHNISIAEQHLVSAAGAVAVVMNARYGWYASGSYPAYSHYYALEFWDAALNEKKVHLGDINQDSRDDNLFRIGSTGVYRWINFEVNLFGDPETSFQVAPSAPKSEIHGIVVNDLDGNGLQDSGEYGLGGEILFLDEDNDGIKDNQEIYIVTGNDGRYAFLDLDAGTYSVRHVLSSSWLHISPADGLYNVDLLQGEVKDKIDFMIKYFPPDPPDTPANLSADTVSEYKIDLSWQDNSDNETCFKIERSTDGVNFSEKAIVGANIAKYTDSSLQPGTRYHYRVRASNDGGVSDYSNVDDAVTLSVQITINKLSITTGRAGSPLTIYGSGFGLQDSVSNVHFFGEYGEANAPISQWKDTSIKCKVPRLTKGKYSVKVIKGQNESNIVNFEIK